MSLKRRNNQITAILLAAGGSQRLGYPKQLIHFDNGVLINFILRQIKFGGLTKIKVVLGSHFKEIENQIIYDDVDILENLKWEEGISSSLKCGINNLDDDTQAVMVFIVDQPYLDSRIIEKIINKLNTSDANIIAVNVSGQITHPVLFRRALFPKLLELKGDVGGKAIFKEEILETVFWDDKRLLIDIDSVEDCEKLKSSNA